MKYYFRLGFVLLVITAVASGILAYINSFTEPIIKENQREAKEEARMQVLPEAVSFDSISFLNEEVIYAGKNNEGQLAGYTFVASLYGYSSDLKTMVGVTPDFKVNKIKIIEQTETPGLGANCTKPEFQFQFENKNETVMLLDKDGGEIVSITGATITTRTITNSIRTGLKFLKEIEVQSELEEMHREEVTE